MSDINSFKNRLNDLRTKAGEYEDKDDVLKSLDLVEKAWEEAAKAAKLKECQPVAAALGATQRSADVLAYNILFCNTAEVSPQALLNHVVKFQALEQVRGAFESTMAESTEQAVAATLKADEIK